MKKITFIAALLISVASFAQIVTVAGTSFEEEPIVTDVNDGQYMDTGDASVAHDLVNNPLQTPVDQSGGVELSIDARYVPYDTPGEGLTDGDFVGVTTFTPTGSDPYPDGVQGYQFSDADGNMIAEFGVVDLSNYVTNSVSLDYFIAETGWEGDGTENNSGNDRIRIFVRDLSNAVDIDILNTEGSDINDLGIEGAWTTASVNIPDGISAQLVIEFRCNAGSEALFIDNVKIEGEEVLGVNDQDANQFSIFPNPATKGFVNITSQLEGDKSIAVFDVLGKQVINTTISNDRLNISDLSSGFYIVKVSQENSTSTKKLVVK